jgi:hypothetical protein
MDEINQEEARQREANVVSLDEFKVITQRVDTMETSIGTIVNRVCFFFYEIKDFFMYERLN